MEQKPKELKRIVYKAPGHAPKVMHVDAKYLCNLKHLVANADIVEHVPMIPAIVEGSPIQICVDEDGHPKGLPFNFYIPVQSTFFPIQMIVGVAVFAKFKPLNIYEDDYDYQLDSLNDTEIKLINEFLNNGNQAVLEKEFKQMYPDMNSYWTPVVREII